MKEIDGREIQKVEEQLGINFIEPRRLLLSNLNHQIEQLSQVLQLSPRYPVLPERGFLAGPLTVDQEREVGQLLGLVYARAAVTLQDKLTNISIQESKERMVFLPTIFQQAKIDFSLSTLPFHEACGEWAGKPRVFWVRESVAARILKAAQAFETIGVKFHIEDAFRPVGVQEGLFFRRIKMILAQHPEWIEDWDKVWTEARSKTAVNPWMAGHKSGAALDITLKTSDGAPLLLGNIYPEGGPKVALHYPYVTQEEWSTRQLFVVGMEMSGLRTYPYENWHSSFGDLGAGIAAFSTTDSTPNYTAVYGPIKNFDPDSGEIEPYKVEEYYAPFYTKEELLKSLS